MRTQEAGRTSASAIDALRGSGARGVIAGVGAVQAQNDLTTQSIGANLDEQQKNIDMIKANDNVRIQGVNENRYNNDVSALSSQYNSAQDAENQGIANTIQGLGSASASYSGAKNTKDVATSKYKDKFGNPIKFEEGIGYKPKY